MSLPQEDPKFESVFSKLRREHNSESPPKNSKPSENNSTRNNRNTKSQSPGDSEPFSSFSSDFYNKGRKDRGNRPPRPKLSERLFSNRKVGGGSVFEDPLFVNDLRKELDNERKMFFDGVDPFGHFPSPRSRGTSPQPATGGGGGSARAGAGFPFESTARTRLDDLAGRHPMFSTMRRQPWDDNDPFARAGSPFQRERNNSGSSGCASGSSTASAGEHEHIIPIRIERSDGTTTTTSGGAATTTASANASTSTNGKNPISSIPIPMPAPEGMTPVVSPQQQQQQQPPKVQQTLGPQRSSTTEVRKSPSPAPGERSPRAQSAPPDSMNEGHGDKKFVSSVNIQSPSPAAPSSGPQVTQLGGNCTKEQPVPGIGARQIPILIDGILGRAPNRAAAQPMPNVPQPPQQQPQQQKQTRPAERDLTPPSSKKPTIPKDPMEKILEITTDVKEWEAKIDVFTGTSRKDKEYMILDEMLTRDLIKLDVIETEGREDVRQARKDCIKLIQNCIAKLENKVPLPNTTAASEEMELTAVLVNGVEPHSHGEGMEVDQKSCSKESVPSSDAATSNPAIPLGSGGEAQAGTGNSG